MADVFRQADVLGVLFAWDAETNTGLPPVTNDFVAGCVRAHPDAFVGFASVDPQKGDAAVAELERAVRELGLRGLKLHPTRAGVPSRRPGGLPDLRDRGRARDPGDRAHRHDRSRRRHAGRRQPEARACHGRSSLDAVAADFPRLQIVMAHPAWPWQDEQLAVALHKPNTWIDLSGWSPRRFAPDLVRNIKGALQDRVLFGTDYPFLTHEQWFGAWGTLGVPDAITEKVLLHERGAATRTASTRAGVTRAHPCVSTRTRRRRGRGATRRVPGRREARRG